MDNRKVRIGIDVGGTFTDAVVVDNETYEVIAKEKVPTTHHAERGVAQGIIEAINTVLTKNGISPDNVIFIAHGTTQATNALLEGDVARVGIVGMGSGMEAERSRKETTVGNIELAPGKYLYTEHEFIDAASLTDEAVKEAIDALKLKNVEVIVASESYSVDNPENEQKVIGLAVKEGKTASPTIQPDYREIGRWLGERLRTKKQKIGIIADWKMSEAVQAEISGLTEALEGSGSEISWCIYRRKEQDIVERMKKETEADALVILDEGILEEFGEQAENGTYEGAELYGVGYSLKTIALLDNGNIQGLAVPDGYEIGYKSVEEITKRIEHRSYKMQGYITEYQVLGKENFSMDEDLERFLYSYE